MRELLQRTFFGLIYVLIVVFSLQSYDLKALLMLFFMIMGLVEFSKLIHTSYQRALLPAFFIFMTSYLYFYKPAVNLKVLSIAFGFMLIALFIPFIYFIFDKISRQMLADIYLSLVYLSLPFSLALGIDEKLLLSVFIIIWSSDTFAYLTGKYLGKHKLAEKISPKKTIEGLLGGLLGSLLVAFLIMKYTDWNSEIDLYRFLALALLIVITGTLGDLLESRFKRLAGVKDSGNIIPGHGGVLDRLDSFILAIPFVFAYLLII